MEFLTYKPLFLLLLLVAMIFGMRYSLVDRPKWMRRASFACRLLALLLLILALCRPYWIVKSDEVHVAFLIDVSESVEPGQMRRALAGADAGIAQLDSGDSHSLFVFANGLRSVTKEALTEWIEASEQGTADADFRKATRLDDALRMARLSFPSGKARRMMVFSDGRENGYDLETAMRQMATEGVDLRFSQLESMQTPEAAVLALEPASGFAFAGEVVRMRVVMQANEAMSARLRILHQGVVVAEQDVTLADDEPTEAYADLEMFTSGASRWTAELVPERDYFPINNQVSATVEVKGRPRVLVIHTDPRKMRGFGRAMKRQGIDLEIRGARGLPDTLEALLAFDAIVLADVPATELRPLQLQYLKRYVAEFGGGLAMLGSENSFGLGGYYRTPVEDVLPLTSRYEKEKQKPSLAMVLVIDKSGSMGGVPIALARQAARSAAELLSSNDQIAVIGFDSNAVVICEMTSAGNRSLIANSIDSLQAGGGTNLYPGMELGREMLERAPARIKHMIILSDGQTGGGGYDQMAQEMSNRGITISTVALGQGAARGLMAQIAQTGRGRYYETNDPNSVPQIFTKETVQASKSAIKEDLFGTVQAGDHPIMNGYEQSDLPMVLGYVMTRANPTAQVLLVAESGDPLLAVSRYGLGTGLAYTSDLTERWGSEWLAWSGGGRFWAQALRGILKKETRAGMRVEMSERDERLSFEVFRHDAALRPVNQIEWLAQAVDGRGAVHSLQLRQVGLGHYRGELSTAGLERMTVNLTDSEYGQNRVLRWQRPYPEEYRLGGQVAPALEQLPSYDSATVRTELSAENSRRDATPAFALGAIFFCMLGIALRRL